VGVAPGVVAEDGVGEYTGRTEAGGTAGASAGGVSITPLPGGVGHARGEGVDLDVGVDRGLGVGSDAREGVGTGDGYWKGAAGIEPAAGGGARGNSTTPRPQDDGSGETNSAGLALPYQALKKSRIT
jgi:hypothetical protein